MATFVDARAYPVFAVMFGYGLVQIARRQRAAGADERRVLLRRNAFLVVFGFFHATLLYFGDFLGAYGIVGIIATLVLLCGWASGPRAGASWRTRPRTGCCRTMLQQASRSY